MLQPLVLFFKSGGRGFLFTALEFRLLLLREGHYLGPVRRNRQRMLSMGRRFTVQRDDRPPVIKRACILRTEVQHRFDRKAIAGPDLLTGSGTAVIRYLRGFMHLPPDPVAGI